MKKYFFLLFLFMIYLVITLSNNDTKQVLSSRDIDNQTILSITLNFSEGINSNDLNNIFSKYNKEYYIEEISLSDEKLELSCKSFSSCIMDVFNIKDDDFYNKYILNGFMIKNLSFIAYKEEIISFLNNEKINYTVNY